MNKLCINDLDKEYLNNKSVIVRVDFNVPLKDGKITDNTRIVESLPTIKFLLENNSKVILMSHLGRPDGVRQEKYSLKPVAIHLEELLGKKVLFLDDCVGENVKSAIGGVSPGALVLLENLRFYKEETDNNPDFSRQLSELAEIYVNDAFGTAHRAHASTPGIADYLPAYGGFLMEKEIEFLGKTVENPPRPFVAIIGGAKVSSKIGVLNNLVEKADKIIIGGAMTYTFMKAKGEPVGNSMVENDYLETATKILNHAEKSSREILLAIDHVVADSIDSTDTITVRTIPDGKSAFDIGSETIAKIRESLMDAKTIIWNGPFGVLKKEQFANGTKKAAECIAELTKKGCITIVGGGDSVAAIEKSGLKDSFSHISTGGGASLEFLEGKELPGIKVLKDK